MSRPCMLNDGKLDGSCEEEAAPGSPFCYAHMKTNELMHSFAYCEQHEVVHLSHFRCPACVLQELGFNMDVLHDDYPYGSNGKYVKGNKKL
jgi:hypothetical protein